MRKSVSRVIARDGDGDLVVKGDGTTFAWISDARRIFRKDVPAASYRVTYALDPRGSFVVFNHWGVVNVRRFRGTAAMEVCFLPLDWADGSRVSRTVVPLRPKR